MGQKVNPKGFRLGVIYTWDSRWFADKKNYQKLLLEDVRLRRVLIERLKPAGIAKVEIERSINKIDIKLFVSRPGLVIGRAGQGLEDLKKFIDKFLQKEKNKIKTEIKVEPIKEPNLNAYLVANNIIDQLLKRLPQRRIAAMTIEKVLNSGARGVKIILSGRIGGAEISRRETYKSGTIPLSTLREDIDYAQVPALTRSGYVGVKVWICK